MTFDFDTLKDTATGRSTKWVKMDMLLGEAPAPDMLPMWIAQMDFLPAPVLDTALQSLLDTREYGYFSYDDFAQSIAWWYRTRHNWAPDPGHVFATHGIGNAVGMTLQALTAPGDGIIVFSPVYHEFANKIRRNGRTIVESPLLIDEDGLFRMDLDGLQSKLTGAETAVLFCTPHNPAGRVWDATELQALSAFCARNDLLLMSDEIHHDLVFAGRTHQPTALAAPDSLPRLVVMSAASKTFDIAGLRTGYIIIPDDALRAKFAAFYAALDIQPNRLGADMTVAAYSPDGAAWVDGLVAVLDDNHKAFNAGMNTIPGVSAMPMQGTYLTWIDFTGTGLSEPELKDRITGTAHILPTPGKALGQGGDLRYRFNIGTNRATIDDAVARLQEAFADLQ